MANLYLNILTPLKLVPLNSLLTLKNHFSYKYHYKKRNKIKNSLENRLNNSIEELAELRLNEPSNWEIIRNSEINLYKILQLEIDFTNKDILEKLKSAKNSFQAFSDLEKYLSVLELSIKDKELEAINEFTHDLYIIASGEEYIPKLKDFEKKYRDTKISKNCRKIRLKLSNKDQKYTYFNILFNKLSTVPLSYSPEGKLIQRRYKINKGRNKLKYKRKSINLKCIYSGKVLTAKNIKQKKSNICCYFAEEISPNAKEIIRNNSLLFGYSLKNKKLYYNLSDQRSEIFSKYFDPKKEPLSVEEILSNFPKGGKNGII